MNGNGPELTQAMPFIPNKPVVYAGDVVIGRASESRIGQLSSSINDFKAGEFFFIHPRIFSFTTDFFHL
ncbi:Uncharacterised protein [Alcaligenes faecalis]|nr:hypothetical protein CPY64_09770 [Alcaligenes faecalis]AYZ92786.1 hypothetical protein EGY22_15540 [Alcaligenes faecalis]GAU71919.1 hypothetical protein AFA2_00229 [Alcaligenes faecalis subsp. faecalis NBRC 13111]CAJ0905664.1 Gamma carbonic anhydrase family protein [Alcaligenes faecalis subsp. faecalis]CUI43645.1 Uncharacterised protein [Alcaligenes faecalis]